MQHYHAQCFRCSLPRRRHAECAALFFQEEDFVKHLTEDHGYVNRHALREQVGKSRIGVYEHKSRFQFYYWCGFCREIRFIDKPGVEAYKERFDHIETEHFQKGQNIKQWFPAKGHTMKGARKKRDKNRKKKDGGHNQKPGGKRQLEDIYQPHPRNDGDDHGHGDGDGDETGYEVCSSSEDDTDIEAQQLSNNYIQKNKTRRVNSSEKESIYVYCVS